MALMAAAAATAPTAAMAEAEPEVRDAEPPPQSLHTPTPRSRWSWRGRNDVYWWILALLPVCWLFFQVFGLTGLIIAVSVFVVVIVSYVALTRCGLDGEKIVGGIIGVLGGLYGVVTLLKIQFPASVLWMSGIVCRRPYHLEYDVSHYSVRPGESSSSVDYACVNGESLYDINDFMVTALQGLLIALVLCPVVAVGLSVWRRRSASDQQGANPT
jgi:hypothetical protein